MTTETPAETAAIQELPEQTPEQAAEEQRRAQEAFEARFMEGKTPSKEPEKPKTDASPGEAPRDEKGRFVAKEESKEEPKEESKEDHELVVETDESKKLVNRLRALEGRMGTVLRDNKALAEELATLKKGAKESPSSTPPLTDIITASLAGNDKVKALQEDWEDHAGAIGEVARVIGEAVESRVSSISGAGLSREELDEKIDEARVKGALDALHTDWEETVKSPEFRIWVDGQNEKVRALAHTSGLKAADRLLTLYEESLTVPNTSARNDTERPDPKQRLREAIAPTRSASRPATRSRSAEEAFEASYRRARGLA